MANLIFVGFVSALFGHVLCEYNPAATSAAGDMLLQSNQLQLADGTVVYFKNWNVESNTGQTFVFGHPLYLDSDVWDAQMMFFGLQGHHVMAFDRRGHGRSSQPWTGNNMEVYADNLNSLFTVQDIKKATLVGHATGGGEIARYIGKYGSARVSYIVLLNSVTPMLAQSASNPNGVPLATFDAARASILADKSEFFETGAIKYYGANRAGANVSKGLLDGYWFNAMQGGIKTQYDTIKAYSETDFTADLKKFDKPTLILHGGDNQNVPAETTAVIAHQLIPGSVLKIYPGYPHGMAQLHSDEINQDILNFVNTH